MRPTTRCQRGTGQPSRSRLRARPWLRIRSWRRSPPCGRSVAQPGPSLVARSILRIVFGTIGLLFARAARDHDPSQAGGMADSLHALVELGRWPFGGIWLSTSWRASEQAPTRAPSCKPGGRDSANASASSMGFHRVSRSGVPVGGPSIHRSEPVTVRACSTARDNALQPVAEPAQRQADSHGDSSRVTTAAMPASSGCY